VEFTVHSCGIYSTSCGVCSKFLMSLQCLPVEFTVHSCGVYSTFLWSLQYIPVEFTVHSCGVYSIFLWSLQYILDEFSVHYCEVYKTANFRFCKKTPPLLRGSAVNLCRVFIRVMDQEWIRFQIQI
jgi:hypothetical protein